MAHVNEVYVESYGDGSEENQTEDMKLNELDGEEGGIVNEGLDRKEETEGVDCGISKENGGKYEVRNSDAGAECEAKDAVVNTEDQIEKNDSVEQDLSSTENNDLNVAEESHNIHVVGEYETQTTEEERTEHADINEENETPSNRMNKRSQTENVEQYMENDVRSEDSRRTTPPPSYAEVVHEETDEVRTTEFIINAHVHENLPPPANHWYTVDRSMLACKMGYFFDQAKEGSLWPYLVLFQVSSGLGTFQAGIINGLRFIGCLIGGPLWGMIADQKRIHRPLILIITSCAILLQCSQPFWAEYLGPEDKNCCPTRSNETIEEAEKRQSGGKVDNSKMFYTLLFISMVACFFDGTTLSFVDSGVQRKIKASTKPIDFGRQRQFGSLGYAVGSMASSAGVQYFFHADISCYAGMFFCYFVFGVCLMISFSHLFKGTNATTESNAPMRSSPSTNANPKVNQIIWKTLKSFHIIFFLATVLFNGLMRALVFSFTYLYLEELGAPTMLLGTSMVVSQAASFIFYALTEKIIDLAGGTMQVMCLSCFSWVIRLLCLAFMKSYWLILPINVLNGVSASLFVGASIIHVRKTCPPVAYTTMYGIRNSLFNGGGYILANVIGGELYQVYGAKHLFLYTCLICAGWVTIMVAYLVKYRRTSIEVVEDIELRPPSYEVKPLPS